MPHLAYLFERFPSFTQTFCYREIVELRRQDILPAIFSVRRPVNEPAQDWDKSIVRRIEYFPDDKVLVQQVDRDLRRGKFLEAVSREIASWGRKTDFLRLYQAAHLGSHLHELGIRHVHAHFAGLAARIAYWIERFFGIGFSFTAHANDIFAPKPFEISLGKLVEAARAVITVSDFGVRFLQDRFPERGAKILRVYNGIEIDQFRSANFVSSPPRLISVGRLIEKKGFSDLIEACRLLRARGIDFRCEIIGEGPLEQALRGQIVAAGLTSIILLTGPLPQDEVRNRLAGSAVFALPSVTEAGGGMDNLPTVVMEAMASGLPVVSTPVGGIPEMVCDGTTGLLVPEHDPAAVAQAMASILVDPSVLYSLGEAGRARALDRFDIANSVASLRGIWRQVGNV